MLADFISIMETIHKGSLLEIICTFILIIDGEWARWMTGIRCNRSVQLPKSPRLWHKALAIKVQDYGKGKGISGKVRKEKLCVLRLFNGTWCKVICYKLPHSFICSEVRSAFATPHSGQ